MDRSGKCFRHALPSEIAIHSEVPAAYGHDRDFLRHCILEGTHVIERRIRRRVPTVCEGVENGRNAVLDEDPG